MIEINHSQVYLFIYLTYKNPTTSLTNSNRTSDKTVCEQTVCEKGADNNYYSSTELFIPERIITLQYFLLSP
jgi:hypothetical protein